MTIRTLRASTLLTAVFVVSAGWLAVPHARQEQGANDGFILFTTDRDNPSEAGICSNCEEIYHGTRRVPVRFVSLEVAPMWLSAVRLTTTAVPTGRTRQS